MGVVRKHSFHHQLAEAVGVDGELRLILGDGDALGCSVGGGGTGEDEFGHSGGPHGFQERERGRDVVAVVLRRVED